VELKKNKIMQQDLLIQAEKMFENDLQKWNSFLELVSQKDTILKTRKKYL